MEIGEELLLAPSLYFITCLEPSPDKGTIVKVCVEAFTVDKISLTFFFPTVELFPWDLYRLTAYEGKAGIEDQAHNSQENNGILSAEISRASKT